MTRTLLYSPVPPQKTGTADYLNHILKEARKRGASTDDIKIVVNPAFYDAYKYPKTVHDFEVLPYQAVANVAAPDERRFYFLANNTFHAYCYRSLALLKTHHNQQIVSVVHEPNCFMLFNNMCHNGIAGFSLHNLNRMGEVQFGDFANKVILDLNSGNYHPTTEYSFHFQEIALKQSTEIWTHSRYAALKLLLESNFPLDRMPTFKVYGHPNVALPLTGARRSQQIFRIGIFGWVAKSKRMREILEGFRLFLAQIDPVDLPLVEMVVVGAAPDEGCQPDVIARGLDIGDYVKVFGYVEENRMNELIAGCSLILNLRFPSCGETSGTLHRAVEYKVPVVTTSYQAFRELHSSMQISMNPLTEIMDIRNAMMKYYRIFKGRQPLDGVDDAHQVENDIVSAIMNPSTRRALPWKRQSRAPAASNGGRAAPRAGVPGRERAYAAELLTSSD